MSEQGNVVLEPYIGPATATTAAAAATTAAAAATAAEATTSSARSRATTARPRAAEARPAACGLKTGYSAGADVTQRVASTSAAWTTATAAHIGAIATTARPVGTAPDVWTITATARPVAATANISTAARPIAITNVPTAADIRPITASGI
jgi:hypothetical protein